MEVLKKDILLETLNDLTFEELDDFKSFIKFEIGFPPISRQRLRLANAQNIVELMVGMSSKDCLKTATRVLMKMDKTDLVQRLSEVSLALTVGPNGKAKK